MIDVKKIKWRIILLTTQGEQLDLTNLAHGVGLSENPRELSMKLTLKLANTQDNLFSQITPFQPIFLYAGLDSFAEIFRGTIQRYELTDASDDFTLELDAYDEVMTLRRNQDSFFFTPEHSSSAILSEIFEKWGVPFNLNLTDATHDKKVYRKKYLIDMIEDVLKDMKEKGAGEYLIQARQGVINILPRGTNETTLHFDIDSTLTKVHESFDVTQIVTRVLVVGKLKEEGHQSVESTIDGKIDLGIRQVIYERADKTTLEEAQTAAQKILDEQGDADHDVIIEAPFVPSLRRGDRVRVRTSSGQRFYFIKAATHNFATQKMTLTLEEEKENE